MMHSHKQFRKRVTTIILCTMAWLTLIDGVFAIASRVPDNVHTQPSQLERYFDYGRSIEGKLRHEVGLAPSGDAAIV